MKLTTYIFLTLGTLCYSSSVIAQNILTTSIEWTCTSTFTADPGTLVDEVTRVVTTSQQIIWYDSQNNVRQTMSIVSSEGSWTNVSHNGSMLFKVTSGNDSGIVKFYRINGEIKIRIHIALQDSTPIYELDVSNTDSL